MTDENQYLISRIFDPRKKLVLERKQKQFVLLLESISNVNLSHPRVVMLLHSHMLTDVFVCNTGFLMKSMTSTQRCFSLLLKILSSKISQPHEKVLMK